MTKDWRSVFFVCLYYAALRPPRGHSARLETGWPCMARRTGRCAKRGRHVHRPTACVNAPMLHLHTDRRVSSLMTLAAFRSAPPFENYDLTHAPLSVEANSLLSEGGCACMSSTLTVRRIAADQGGVYRELRAASLREPYAPGEAPEAELLTVEADAASAIAAQRAVSDESTTFLLYTEGHPAGMIGAYFDNTPDRRAFVSELWVAHAVRHLRGGVLLLETATAWLAERGATDVYAWIADANRNAIRFYERAGFGNTGEHAPIARMPGAMKSLFVSQVKH
ncbi:UNVERIFIED_ORG: ribosomal protein S18 acetylase RimI-like enzyme [Burkholderia cepacia]|nr:ribosomal protein S18 acetylase RimI-like enzyme [Burkholderia cepacia]MDP9592669.1 ribosomal protein S18 acetylase RimI-like enzyme [Burkholderia cepacia]